MTQLIIAALVWIALHLGVAGTTLRDVVVAASATSHSAASSRSCRSRAGVPRAGVERGAHHALWVAPDWLRWVLMLAMLPAFVLFVASVNGRTPP